MNELLDRPGREKGERQHSWIKPAVELGPLVLFFIANARAKLFEPLAAVFLPPTILGGPNAALFIAAAVLMAAVAMALTASYLLARRLPVVPLMTAALVFVFGGLTLDLQDATFIKMNPTVLYTAVGFALSGGLAVNKPVLQIVFDSVLSLPERGWRLLTLRWGGFFLALAILNEIVWRTQSNDLSVAFKFPGIFILILLFSLAQAPFISCHALPELKVRDGKLTGGSADFRCG